MAVGEVSWTDAVDRFSLRQSAQGVAPASIAKQQRQLKRAAVELGGSPGRITEAQLSEWLTKHPGTPRSVKSVRITMRAFYRWAQDAGLVERSPMPASSPVSRYRLEERWQDALEDFEAAQGRDGIAPASIVLRVKHVTRLAQESEQGPWALSAVTLRDWLDSLPCGDRTRQAHRVSIRAFYRWATAAGRIAQNPTDEDSTHILRLGMPPQWAVEVEAYLRALRGQGRPVTTLAARRSQLERFARDHRTCHPYDLTLDDLQEWSAAKRWAAETRRGHRSAIVSFYRWAEQTARVDASPAEHWPVVKPSQPRPRPAMEHEIAAALAGASARERLAIRLSAELGLRCSEVAQLHSRDLLHLPGDEQWWLLIHGKGSRERRVPLTTSLAHTLRAQPAGYVFPSTSGGHLTPRYLGKIVSRLLPEGVTMHALRHRFATLAYNLDRDVFAVQHWLGHASPATTQRYVLVGDQTLRTIGQAVALR